MKRLAKLHELGKLPEHKDATRHRGIVQLCALLSLELRLAEAQRDGGATYIRK